MLLKRTKNKIIDLARNAVMVAETTLGSGKGKEKKEMAIRYILKNIPLPPFLKNILFSLLSSFIDDAIESAVKYLKTLPKIQGD